MKDRSIKLKDLKWEIPGTESVRPGRQVIMGLIGPPIVLVVLFLLLILGLSLSANAQTDVVSWRPTPTDKPCDYIVISLVPNYHMGEKDTTIEHHLSKFQCMNEYQWESMVHTYEVERKGKISTCAMHEAMIQFFGKSPQ